VDGKLKKNQYELRALWAGKRGKKRDFFAGCDTEIAGIVVHVK
jgi:hypothetical protein